jgi:hypothetical protein
MSIFTATFSAVAVTAAQDCFEIVAGSNTRVRILDCKLAQYSDAGDAAAEILSVQVIRGFTTTGSGGAAVTPVNLQPWSRVASSTVARNNTTVAQNGTGAILVSDGWHVAAGWSLRDSLMVPDGKGIWLEKTTRLVVRITIPADSLTVNGTLVFEETGMAPA